MKQYFIKINRNLDHVHCGTLEIEKNNTALNFFIKDQAADILSVQDALLFINQKVSQENGQDKKVVFYVHGFWASLSFALHRTASAFQKHYFKAADSKVVAIVHIIWNANSLMYKHSVYNIADSKASLALLLNEIPHKIENRYSLMSHSMGNRFLYETLNAYTIQVVFEELILVAPDLDFKLFEDKPHLFTDRANQVAVCYHTKDKTLKLSAFVNSAQRLGRTKTNVSNPKIKFIDYTALKDIKTLHDKLMRHLYFITSKTVGKEIQAILNR